MYNPVVGQLASRKWREKNRQKHREYCAKWKLENPDARKQHDKNYRAAHPEAHKRHKHLRRARERQAEGSFTHEEWDALKHRFDMKCAKCREAKPLTIDHIVPLAKGGRNDITNIQPLCITCNQRKGVS